MAIRWLYPLVLATFLTPNIAASTGCSDSTGASACGENGGKSGAVFRYGGKEFHQSDLDIRVREMLYQAAEEYYQERQLLLDNAVWQVYLAQEAKRRKIQPEQLAMELIDLAPPTEQAMQAFYEANKAKMPAPYEQVKRQLAQYLIQQQALEARSKLIASIKKEGQYTLLIEKPQPPINVIETEGFPSKGSMLAPVEVVEFADYQCPHCKTASAIMQRLEKRYGDKIRVVFMDFPINRSGISLKVAEGGVCADQQDRFWDYHNGAFEQQASLSAKSPQELASRLGLDLERFSSCLTGTEAVSKVAKSKAEARRLGLDSTPTFFVNGVRLNAESSLEQELSAAINKALEQSGDGSN